MEDWVRRMEERKNGWISCPPKWFINPYPPPANDVRPPDTRDGLLIV